MKRHASRLRHMQRRYHRKGRRKAPLGRPPDKRNKLNFIKRPTRTYDFNTIPSTGEQATRWQYIRFVSGRLHFVFQQLELKERHNHKYLQQQRHLYYGTIGIRYKHILPKHSHLRRQATTNHTNSTAQPQPQTTEDLPYLPLDPSTLPPTPPNWSTTTNLQHQLHYLPRHPPYSHQSLLWLAIITLMLRSPQRKFRSSTSSSIPSLTLTHIVLSFFGLVIATIRSPNAPSTTSSPTGRIPTYNSISPTDTHIHDMTSKFSYDMSPLPTSSYVCRQEIFPPNAEIPEDDDMENPSTIAQMWKLNCPEGQERILYNLIKDKNDEALGRWNHIYHGKQAHSL